MINVLYSVPDEVWIHLKFETIICAGLQSSHQSRSKRFVEFWEFTASSLEPAIWGTPIAKSLERAISTWGVSDGTRQIQDLLQVMLLVYFQNVTILILPNLEVQGFASSQARHDRRPAQKQATCIPKLPVPTCKYHFIPCHWIRTSIICRDNRIE